MAETSTHLEYRRNAGICLVNNEGKIFQAQRKKQESTSLGWQMPQGGIDAGEAPLPAALRELFEETGIPEKDVRLVSKISEWLTYDFPPDIAAKMGSRGQKQQWFCFQYIGDGHIDLTQAQDHEFDDWRWAQADDILEQVINFKEEVYTRVLAEFKNFFIPK